MTRYHLPLLALLLLLTACGAGAKNAPGANRTGAEPQNSPMVTELPPTPQKSATPDFAAQTQGAKMVQDAANTKQVQDAGYRASTETKAISLTSVIYNAQTLTAQPRAQTATKSAQSTDDMLMSAKYTQESDHATQTKDAPADVATAQHLLEYAKSEPVRAWTEPILNIGGGIGLGAFGLAMLLIVAMKWQWYDTAQEETPAPQSDWVQKSANSIARRGSSADDVTLNISDGAKLLYFEYALGNHSLGINAVKRALKNVADDELETATDYMDVHGYIVTEKVLGGGRRNVLSGAGRHYAEGEMVKLSNSPAPDEAIPETGAPTQHERAETSVSTEGEVAIDPTYAELDNFGPERSGGAILGILMPEDKDDEK